MRKLRSAVYVPSGTRFVSMPQGACLRHPFYVNLAELILILCCFAGFPKLNSAKTLKYLTTEVDTKKKLRTFRFLSAVTEDALDSLNI